MNLLVSICCLSYNHQTFLRECLAGFMMQKTNFAFEVLIHDDASTDKSADIIREYELKYPDIIKPIYQTENQYSKGVGISITYQFPRAKGKYIAMCEGDDYWTDPLKLQKQVDFLEANEEYSMCFHPVKIWKEGELIEDYITREVPETTTIFDLAEGNYIHTPSAVFRKNQEVIEDFTNMNAAVGDYVLHMLNARYGMIKKLPNFMAVYRVHGGGVYSGEKYGRKQVNWSLLLVNLMPYFNENVSDRLRDTFLRTIGHTLKDGIFKDITEKKALINQLVSFPDIIINEFILSNQRENKIYELENNKSIKKTINKLKEIIKYRYFK